MTKAEHLISRAMELIENGYEAFMKDKALKKLSNETKVDAETIYQIAQYIKYSYIPYITDKIYRNLKNGYGYSLDDATVEKCLNDFSEEDKSD